MATPPESKTQSAAVELVTRSRANRRKFGQPRSPRTRNSYLEVLNAFVRWAVKDGRLPANLLATISKLDEAVDIRRQRRASDDDDLAKLIDAAVFRVPQNLCPVLKKDLEFAEPAVWTCPQCGSAYLTPDLQPRCAVCGYREGS